MTFPTIIPRITAEGLFGNLAGVAQILTSTLAVDVVAVYNQETLEQVFPYARPMEASQLKQAKVMDYPVEDGTILSDHKIILPIYVELPLMVPVGDFQATYQQIKDLWKNDTLLVIQTKTDVMRNFIIEQIPDRQSPDAFDKSILRMRLKEVQLITSPTKYAPQNPVDSNTVKRGKSAPVPAQDAPVVVQGNRMTPAVIQYEQTQGVDPTGYRFQQAINNSKPRNLGK